VSVDPGLGEAAGLSHATDGPVIGRAGVSASGRQGRPPRSNDGIEEDVVALNSGSIATEGVADR